MLVPSNPAKSPLETTSTTKLAAAQKENCLLIIYSIFCDEKYTLSSLDISLRLKNFTPTYLFECLHLTIYPMGTYFESSSSSSCMGRFKRWERNCTCDNPDFKPKRRTSNKRRNYSALCRYYKKVLHFPILAQC